eukprot:COSAG01_NODE_958_length_12470_cov_52.097729_10_plen_237_part_01
MALAMELRIEEAKKTLRRMAYSPTFVEHGAESVDALLRDVGLRGGLRAASVEQRHAARAQLLAQAAPTESTVAAWTAHAFGKVAALPARKAAAAAGAGAGGGVPEVSCRELIRAVRRYGRVPPTQLPDSELEMCFGRMVRRGHSHGRGHSGRGGGGGGAGAVAAGSGPELVSAEQFCAFTRAPPSARLAAYLSSGAPDAELGKLQRVQTVAHGRGRAGEDAWRLGGGGAGSPSAAAA